MAALSFLHTVKLLINRSLKFQVALALLLKLNVEYQNAKIYMKRNV